MAADLMTADGPVSSAPLLDHKFIAQTVQTFQRRRKHSTLTAEEAEAEAYWFVVGKYRPERFSVAKSPRSDPVTALRAHAAISIFRELQHVENRAQARRSMETSFTDCFVTRSVNDALPGESPREIAENVDATTLASERAQRRAAEAREALVRLRQMVDMDWLSASGAKLRKFFAAVERTGDLAFSARYAGLDGKALSQIRVRYGAAVRVK